MKKAITFLRIAEAGNPVLRKIATPVSNPLSSDIQTLIDNMIATCREQGGVGMAASQVYRPIRLMIVASVPTPAYPTAPNVKPFAAMNPVILSASPKEEYGWEGCMSVPGIRAKVLRPATIKVEYTDRKGVRVRKTLSGLVARIFQHELDHMDGVFFLDKADVKTLATGPEYQKIIAKKGKAR